MIHPEAAAGSVIVSPGKVRGLFLLPGEEDGRMNGAAWKIERFNFRRGTILTGVFVLTLALAPIESARAGWGPQRQVFVAGV